MDAVGALNPVEVIEGKIQAKVARFLSLKEDLNNLRSSSMLNIRQKAEKLYVAQGALELDLATNLERIKIMKSGAWDVSGIVQVGAFAMEMVKQISNVEDLRKQAQQLGASEQTSAVTGIGEMLLSPVGLGLMGVGLLLLLKR